MPTSKTRRKKSVRASQPKSVRTAGNKAPLETTVDGQAPIARTIVYVHGIGNKPPQSVLKCQWDHALMGFDLGERSRLAYWVNRAYYPQPAPGTCASGDMVDLEEQPTGAGLTVAQHMRSVSLKDEIVALNSNPNAQAILRRIAAKVDQPREDVAAIVAFSADKIRAKDVEAKVLPLPSPVRAWIARKLTRALLRDVNDFLFVPERRQIMRESLESRLRVGGGPFVIVGHSQGSMIAYDVLSRMDPARCDVRLFVTIGSPLGIAEVQDQLKTMTNQQRLAVPRCVHRWLNVADPLDPVAADRKLANDYAPSTNAGVRIKDDVEWNSDSPWHPHSGTGYLSLKVVRSAVREAVDTALFQPVASFVIARDLVRSLENCPPQARNRVLIELADLDVSPGTLDEKRRQVVETIRALVPKRDWPDARLQELRRYVAADLTREEAETISIRLGSENLARASAGLANVPGADEAAAVSMAVTMGDSGGGAPAWLPQWPLRWLCVASGATPRNTLCSTSRHTPSRRSRPTAPTSRLVKESRGRCWIRASIPTTLTSRPWAASPRNSIAPKLDPSKPIPPRPTVTATAPMWQASLPASIRSWTAKANAAA